MNLLDREGGKLMSINMFDTEENMNAAEPEFESMPEKLGGMREQMGGERTKIERYGSSGKGSTSSRTDSGLGADARRVRSSLRGGEFLAVNHKRRRPKERRAGCLLCKPSKLGVHKTADRMKERRGWQRYEAAA